MYVSTDCAPGLYCTIPSPPYLQIRQLATAREFAANSDPYRQRLGIHARGGGGFVLLGEGGVAPPTRMGVLQSRQVTTLPFSCSSTSMYFWHFTLGH